MSERENLVEALRGAWDEVGEHFLEDRSDIDDSMWCAQCNKMYALSDCEVDDGFACPNADHVNKDGFCYQVAGSALLRSRVSGAILVHATVKGSIDHAWLEYDGYAFDFSKREMIQPSQLYRKMMAATEVRVYSRQDAARLISTERHWGPWEEEGD